MAEPPPPPLPHGDAVGDAAPPPPAPPQRRRRVGDMLSAYYGIDVAGGAAGSAAPPPPKPAKVSVLDREGFDAKKHFDSIVSTGLVADVVKQANELDEEVRDLDGDMQMVVYENYSKFIRETDTIKQIKVSMEELKPDLKNLEGSFERITTSQRKVDAGISVRSSQIEGLLRQQRLFKKLKVLIDLPATLSQCLEKGSYGNACQAYSNCAPFLRQHKSIPAFQRVLEDVEHQMGRIRSALKVRLRSPAISAEEAVNSSLTLLDLGEDHLKTEREFLQGRGASLQELLDKSFVSSTDGDEQGSELQKAYATSAEKYLPMVRDTVVGMRKLQGMRSDGSKPEENSALADFVSARIEDLSARITRSVQLRAAPTKNLVECMTMLKEPLGQLQELMPQQAARLAAALLPRLAELGIGSLFSHTSATLVEELARLHGECLRLQDTKNHGMDGLMEELSKVEERLEDQLLEAVISCQPLLGSLSDIGQDSQAGGRTVSRLDRQLSELCSTFAEGCRAYVGDDIADPVRRERLASLVGLDWAGGLFSLALVWLGRRLQDRTFDAVWTKAGEVCTDLDPTASELSPCQTLLKDTQAAAEAAMGHFVTTCGQRLATFLNNSMKNRDWKTAGEPQEPSVVVEMVFKELRAFDCQLGRALGDPRQARRSSNRRVFDKNRSKEEVELALELARKQPVFANVPFSRSAAVAGILRVAFKALYECVQEETFGRGGLQQVQVDCEMFLELVRDFVEEWEEASMLGALLHEVVESALKRSTDPAPMDDAAVEQLCDKKKKSMRAD